MTAQVYQRVMLARTGDIQQLAVSQTRVSDNAWRGEGQSFVGI
jgi:hypothetical protein